jgi:F0F1-type ATP synthase membrane subunit b/b'
MPQLDKVSYFSQFFWLCFFYLGFYILLVKFFLPKIRRILKVREKKAAYASGTTDSMYEKESFDVHLQTQKYLLEGMKNSRDSLQSSFESTSLWVAQVTKATNAQHFQEVNTQYGQQMKQMTHSLVTTLHDLKTILPPTAHTQCGFQKSGEQKRQKFFNARVLSSLFLLQPKSQKKPAKKKTQKKHRAALTVARQLRIFIR